MVDPVNLVLQHGLKRENGLKGQGKRSKDLNATAFRPPTTIVRKWSDISNQSDL